MALDLNIQFWVNGPARIFVGTAAAGAYEELGLTERGVGVRFMGHQTPIHSDDLGPETPREILLYPDDAFITFDLNQFDQAVWTKVLARIFKPTTQAGTAGLFLANDVATLLQAEQRDFKLLVDAPYSAKPAFTGLNSHHFFSAYLAGQVDEGPLGTVLKKCAGMFHAIPKKQSNGDFKLYDGDTTGKPS